MHISYVVHSHFYSRPFLSRGNGVNGHERTSKYSFDEFKI